MKKINEEIREFICDNAVLFDDDIEFSDSDNIFELGIVNSMFAMKLLTHVETRYSVRIENEDVNIKNFSNVGNIVKLIRLKTNR